MCCILTHCVLYSNTPLFTCDVVEVVEAVEVEAAGLLVDGGGTLASQAGLPQDVPAADAIVAPGAGLETGSHHLGVKAEDFPSSLNVSKIIV